MGERNTILIHTRTQPALCLYFHWHGDAVAQIAQAGLKAAQPRWGDDDYANRLFVQQAWASAGIHLEQETGAGLSVGDAGMHDGYYNPVNIWWSDRQVIIGDNAWTFEDFLDLPPELAARACWVKESYEPHD